jgi:predicted PurR-regulated permease PerM
VQEGSVSIDSSVSATRNKAFLGRTVEATVRIALIAVLALYCFQIVRPFLIPVVWGVIIAVAVHPNYQWLQRVLGGRRTLAALLFVALALVLLITPTVLLSDTLVTGVTGLARSLSEGRLIIPMPPESVASWPLIGPPLDKFWHMASANLAGALGEITPQLKVLARWLLSAAAGAGLGILQFILAIIIAGVILHHGESGTRVSYAIARRLAEEHGAGFIDLARATIRSVSRGILGVALLQAILAGLGFLAAGVPGAGLWAFLCLLLSVIQIGIFPVTLPVVIYVFATGDTTTAVIFLIWNLLVGALDNVLKPLLLGRGVNVPMAVIFVGAIGGFLASGIIGLFIGAVILVLGYELLLDWLELDAGAAPAGAANSGQSAPEEEMDGG